MERALVAPESCHHVADQEGRAGDDVADRTQDRPPHRQTATVGANDLDPHDHLPHRLPEQRVQRNTSQSTSTATRRIQKPAGAGSTSAKAVSIGGMIPLDSLVGSSLYRPTVRLASVPPLSHAPFGDLAHPGGTTPASPSFESPPGSRPTVGRPSAARAGSWPHAPDEATSSLDPSRSGPGPRAGGLHENRDAARRRSRSR